MAKLASASDADNDKLLRFNDLTTCAETRRAMFMRCIPLSPVDSNSIALRVKGSVEFALSGHRRSKLRVEEAEI